MFWIPMLIALLISAVAVAVVVWPILKRGPAPLLIEEDALTDLLQRKDAVLVAIKDMEFDYRVGKLSLEDFERIDGSLRRQAVGLLQQIEKIAPESARLDDELEVAVAAQRRVHAAPLVAPVAVVAKAALAPAALAVQNGDVAAGPVRFCTNCGGRIEVHHKFCASCGQPVTDVQTA